MVAKLEYNADIATLAAFYRLNYFTSSDLVNIAVQRLSSDDVTPALCRLAAENKPTMSEVGSFFETWISDHGLSIPTVAEARFTAAQFFARQILSGNLSPYDGAIEIIQRVGFDLVDGEIFGELIGATSEIDDLVIRYPDDTTLAHSHIVLFEAQIRGVAERIVNASTFELLL